MFTVKVATGDDAFQPDPRGEVIRILERIIQDLWDGVYASKYLTIYDINGNDVGRWRLGEDE